MEKTEPQMGTRNAERPSDVIVRDAAGAEYKLDISVIFFFFWIARETNNKSMIEREVKS